MLIPFVIHFQDFTARNRIKPNISSRPKSIVAVRTHFYSPTHAVPIIATLPLGYLVAADWFAFGCQI